MASRFPHGLICASLILIGCAGYSFAFRYFIIDDAYITFAYAKNFSESGSMVISKSSNVEAISSFLWALLLGISSKFSLNPPIWSKVLGFVLYAASVMHIVSLFVRKETALSNKVYLCVAATLPFGFALWANYGMENALVCFLCFLAADRLPRSGRLNGIVIVPLLLLGVYCSRPEGFGYVFVLISGEILRRLFYSIPKRDLGLGVAVLAVLIVAYEWMGYLYYGVLLPDSAAAKLDSSLTSRLLLGLKYTAHSTNLAVAWPVPVAVIVTVFLVARRSLRLESDQDAAIVLSAGVCASTMAYVLLSGGDWMPAARFYSIALPFSASLIAWGLLNWEVHGRRALLGSFILLFGINQSVVAAYQVPAIADQQRAEDRVLQGMVDDLNEVSRSSDTLALSDIGHAAYSYVGNIFDWWGLASRTVTERGESLGRIKSQTIREIDPEFLVVYANSAEGPSTDRASSGMSKFSRALVEDRSLMSGYCRLGSYFFWEQRYHVLLARKDRWNALRTIPTATSKWNIDRCVPAVSTAAHESAG